MCYLYSVILQLRRLLPLSHRIQKRSVNMLRQIARLQRPPLLQKRQSRTLPRNRAPAIRRQRKRLTPTHPLIVLPDLIVIRLAVRKQGG